MELFPTLIPISRWFVGRSRPWSMSAWWSPEGASSVRCTLLRLLRFAHRNQVPVAPLIDDLAQEHRGRAARNLRRLSRRLDDGTPVVEALEQTPGLLGDEELLSLRFAVQTGTYTQTLDECVAQLAPNDANQNRSTAQFLGYLLAMAIVIIGALSFLMIFIAPTYFAISEELGWDVDENVPLLSKLVEICSFVAQWLPMMAIGTAVVVALAWRYKPWRRWKHRFASQLDSAVANRRSSHILRLLALGLEAGRPLPAALSTLARYHFDRTTRTGLLFARNEIEQGAEAWDSLARAHIVTQEEAYAIDNCEPNLRAWTLRTIAGKRATSADHHSAVKAELVPPIVIVGLGAIVLWIALAFFGYLTSLINALT